MNGKKKNIFLNGVILTALALGLSVYFTVNGNWGAAQAVIILILAAIAGFQFWIWKIYFK